MKKSLFLLLAPLFSIGLQAQDFTWVHGNNAVNKNGLYGAKGVADATTCPGARSGAATWRDGSGNLWLFSGFGLGAYGSTAGPLNDLWKYNVTTNKWTWMNGSQSTGPNYGHPSTYVTMGAFDPANYPCARTFACTWTDNAGNLYLFGGSDHGGTNYYDHRNDLWKYDVSINQWAWINGTNISPYSEYGTEGVPDITNVIGGRTSCGTWKDNSGNFWVFGGFGRAANTIGLLNDLWKYLPSSNMWVWMGGTTYTDEFGEYGSLGVPDPANIPGGRQRPVTWTDNQGNLILFGGNGMGDNSQFTSDNLNDLWVYTLSTGNWTWKKGSTNGSGVVYGTKGVSATANCPGGRNTAVAWKDPTGNLWMFGGRGYDELGYSGQLNDLWKYQAANNSWTWVDGSKVLNQNGTYGTLGVAHPANVPGGRDMHSSWTEPNGTFWIFGGNGRGATGTTSGNLNDLWKYKVCYPPQAPTNVTKAEDRVKCDSESTTLTATSSGTVTWYKAATGGSSIFTGTAYATPALTVNTTYYAQAEGCASSVSRTGITVTVSACSSLLETGSANEALLLIYPNPSKGKVHVEMQQQTQLKIFNALGQQIKIVEPNDQQHTFSLDLSSGVYIFESAGANGYARKKVIVE